MKRTHYIPAAERTFEALEAQILEQIKQIRHPELDRPNRDSHGKFVSLQRKKRS